MESPETNVAELLSLIPEVVVHHIARLSDFPSSGLSRLQRFNIFLQFISNTIFKFAADPALNELSSSNIRNYLFLPVI